jgi:hypothetical protein
MNNELDIFNPETEIHGDPARKRPVVRSYLEKGAYTHEVFSAKRLVAGASFGLSFFDGKNEVFGFTYKENGSNPFQNGRGALLALSAAIVGPDGEPLDFSSAAIRKAYAQIQTVCTYKLLKNSREQHEGLFASLLPSAPHVIKAEDIGTPTNTVRPQTAIEPDSGSLMTRSAGKYAVHFTPQIEWPTIEHSWSLKCNDPSSRSIPAALDNHVLIMYALFLEQPAK